MNNQRDLTPDEAAELAALNEAVTLAIAKRRAWLDTKMHEISRLKVGDDIYRLKDGAKVGKVSRLYRYHQDRDNGVRDTNIVIDYEYQTDPNHPSFSNTSCQYGGWGFGTRQDVEDAMQRQLDTFRSRLDTADEDSETRLHKTLNSIEDI